MKKQFLTSLIVFGIILAAEAAVGGASLGIYSAITNQSNIAPSSDTTPEQQEKDPEQEQQLPIHYTPISNKFECETMTLIGGAVAGEQRGGNPNNPSGGSFVGELNNKIGAGVTFEFNSDMATIAKFIVCVGKRSDKTFNLKTSFALTVNTHEESINSVEVGTCDASISYFGWTEYAISYINIKKGINEIEFVTKNKISSNIDYFRLDTYANLTFHQGD